MIHGKALTAPGWNGIEHASRTNADGFTTFPRAIVLSPATNSTSSGGIRITSITIQHASDLLVKHYQALRSILGIPRAIKNLQ